MDVTTLLSKAHARFRQLRSGELGDNLRAQGIKYRIIWGLESYRLKAIAEEFAAETDDTRQALAEALWKEDIRESKMLATRLYPAALMLRETAESWADAIANTELADQAAMHLLSRVPYAAAMAENWLETPDATPLRQYLALKVFSRMDDVPAAIKQQAAAVKNDQTNPLWLRAAAQLIIDN